MARRDSTTGMCCKGLDCVCQVFVMLVKTHRHQNGIPPGDKWILVGGHTRGNRNLAENFRASITVSACEEMRGGWANHRNPLLAMTHLKKRQKTMQPTQMWSLFDRTQARQPGGPQVVRGYTQGPLRVPKEPPSNKTARSMITHSQLSVIVPCGPG